MTGPWVVGVHGIWNLQVGKTSAEAAKILGRRWTTALRRGLGVDSEVEAAVAYYAHHLVGDAAQGAGGRRGAARSPDVPQS